RAFIDVGANIDVRWRHHHDAPGEIGARSDRAAAGDDADALLGSEAASWVSALVHEAEDRAASRLAAVHRLKRAQSEAEQNPPLHPWIHAPADRLRCIRLRRAKRAGLERIPELPKGRHRFGVADGIGPD